MKNENQKNIVLYILLSVIIVLLAVVILKDFFKDSGSQEGFNMNASGTSGYQESVPVYETVPETQKNEAVRQENDDTDKIASNSGEEKPEAEKLVSSENTDTEPNVSFSTEEGKTNTINKAASSTTSTSTEPAVLPSATPTQIAEATPVPTKVPAPLPVHELKIDLEKYNGGFFSVEKPKGWNIVTAGEYGTFAYLLRDPNKPLRQVFFFGEVGPVYMSKEQQQIDQWYMSSGGYPVPWIDMPVVDPLTPSNFLQSFYIVAQSQAARTFMPQCPQLNNFEIISSDSTQCLIEGGSTELVRALFVENGKVGEGLFMVTVVPFMPFMNGPGGGNAYGLMLTGITAPKEEFSRIQADLVKSVESFTISQEYVNAGIAASNSAFQGIMRAGQTLRETSDMIISGWENRNKTYDIMAEKRSDAILGYERVYDPDSGNIYSVQNGFYSKYDLNRGNYEMNNLLPLPDDNHTLWTSPALNGSAIR